MGSWWIQGIFPYLMLQVIAGLSFSSGASCTVRLLTSAPFLWLGRIGFSLYLIHEVVIYYVKWVIRPDQPLFFAVLPVWSIGLVIPLSLAAAAILFHAVERPGRAWLRGRRFSRREGVRRTDSS